MKDFLVSGWASLSSWVQTAIVVAILACLVLFVGDVRRKVTMFLSEKEIEAAKPETFTPVDYCKTQNRLVCVWDRAPQSVKDFCRKSFEGGAVCAR